MNTQTMIDIQARLNLHDQLLQRLFATVFSGDADSFALLIDDLGETIASRPRTTDPIAAETVEDLQVAMAVQLVRFKAATLEKLI